MIKRLSKDAMSAILNRSVSPACVATTTRQAIASWFDNHEDISAADIIGMKNISFNDCFELLAREEFFSREQLFYMHRDLVSFALEVTEESTVVSVNANTMANLKKAMNTRVSWAKGTATDEELDAAIEDNASRNLNGVVEADLAMMMSHFLKRSVNTIRANADFIAAIIAETTSGEDAYAAYEAILKYLALFNAENIFEDYYPHITEEDVNKAIDGLLNDCAEVRNDAEDGFVIPIYLSYGESGLRHESIKEILDAEDPELAFFEKVESLLEDFVYSTYGEIKDSVANNAADAVDGLCEDAANAAGVETAICDVDDIAEYVGTYIEENVSVDYPFDEYLKEQYDINIFIDMGEDGMQLNEDGSVKEKSGLGWLICSQGHSLEEIKTPSGAFLSSVSEEIANVGRYCQLVFLCRMSLEELIKLNGLIRSKTGTLTLHKRVETGLFNGWNGSGGPFEIELEKDVVIPAELIEAALPNGTGPRKYSDIADIYGMCSSAWGHEEHPVVEE